MREMSEEGEASRKKRRRAKKVIWREESRREERRKEKKREEKRREEKRREGKRGSDSTLERKQINQTAG